MPIMLESTVQQRSSILPVQEGGTGGKARARLGPSQAFGDTQQRQPVTSGSAELLCTWLSFPS